MMERRKVVRLWQQGAGGVLVTLVRVEGSSYRRPGARLLTTPAAGSAGTLSGGCLEADVIKRAAFLARKGAVVERYETTFDDTAEIPFGLGCGGVVDLLFEPLATPEAEALLTAMAASLEGREFKVVSFLPGTSRHGEARTLRRVVYDAAGAVVFASPELSQHKIDCARMLQPGGEFDGRFVELIESPQRLFVMGAGEDARPLVDLAALLGWTVTVADGRAQQARPERFPQAAQVVVLQGQDAAPLGITGRDAVILMTHSYEQDRALLAQMLELQPRYLGLLGSRHRSSVLVAETAAMLGRSVESCCDRLWAPVGMDLGGDGPEAIALAIVAEVQAVATGKLGGSRRLSADDVAANIARGGASRYLQAQCAL
jgi:xanthine/CO dehydrogenase XdhC/CoxF family maturation factor